LIVSTALSAAFLLFGKMKFLNRCRSILPRKPLDFHSGAFFSWSLPHESSQAMTLSSETDSLSWQYFPIYQLFPVWTFCQFFLFQILVDSFLISQCGERFFTEPILFNRSFSLDRSFIGKTVMVSWLCSITCTSCLHLLWYTMLYLYWNKCNVKLYYLIGLFYPWYSQQEFQDVPPADREESQEQRPVSIVSRWF